MIELHIYGFLAILETIFVVSGAAIFLFLRNRSQGKLVSELETKLATQEPPSAIPPQAAAEPPAPVEIPSYADFLREALARSDGMLGEDAGLKGADDPEVTDAERDNTRQLLAARHQFLQMELDSQTLSNDPVALRKHFVDGMQAMMATLAGMQPQQEVMEAEPEEAKNVSIPRESQLESQIAHLRSVIDNQHNVMRELRELLEKEMGDSEELREVVRKLADAEAQSIELTRTLEVMEKEIEEFGVQSEAAGGYDSTPDADMLRELVGNQQNTITRLQDMLRKTIPDAESSNELRSAIEKIQRSNQELGTCVMVLEDENTMLREQIESLQSQLSEGDVGTHDEEPVDSAEIENEIADLPDDPAPGVAAVDDAVVDTGPDEDVVTATEDAEPAAVDAAAPATSGLDSLDAFIGDSDKAAEATVTAEETGDAVVDDIDALLETASTAEQQTDPDAAAAEQELSAAVDESPSAATDDIDALLDDVQSNNAAAASDTTAPQPDDAGINTLQGVEIDADDDAPLSDDDIDALLSGADSKK